MFRKKSFITNVFTLASGTIIAQIIAFVLLPFLSRLYSQEAFGLLATFMAITGVISSIASLKYDTALILPKEDISAYSLLKLSNIIALIISILSLAVISLPIQIFNDYKGYQLLICIGVILNVNNNNSILWNIRLKDFKKTALAKILQVIGVFLFQVVLYKYFSLEGLVYGNLIGMAISGLFLILTRKINFKTYKNISWKQMKVEAVRFKNFPLFMAPSSIILSLTANLPIFFFINHITLAEIGLYGMATKLLSQPVTLISENVKSVTLSYMSEKKNNQQRVFRWFLSIIVILLVVSLIGCILIYFLSKIIITLFLGSEWAEVSTYLIYLCPLLVSWMISPSPSAGIRVFEMQKYELYFSIVSLIAKFVAFSLMFKFQFVFVEIILYYSLLNLLLILIDCTIVGRKIYKYDKYIQSYVH